MARSPDFHYQFREWRYVAGLLLERTVRGEGASSLSLSAGGGYTFGDYAGSSRRAKARFVPVLRAGLVRELGKAAVTLGYQFLDTPGARSHQATLSVAPNW